jgi:hypothetical protein
MTGFKTIQKMNEDVYFCLAQKLISSEFYVLLEKLQMSGK